MAPATVICDPSSIVTLPPPPYGHQALPKSPDFTLGEQQPPPPPTPPHEQEGGSMRKVREHTSELERGKCVGVIYLLFRFGSQVW